MQFVKLSNYAKGNIIHFENIILSIKKYKNMKFVEMEVKQ